jgi:2'-hydroxyisoflavone reductase
VRLLVMGGTSFVGRTIVAAALRGGHHVTTLNRGRTGDDVDGVETLRGDRSTDDGLHALAGRDFDAVLDPGGIVPAHVLRTVRTGLAPYYAYVSSTAVYQSWDNPGLDESAATWPGVPDEDGDPADFARLRAHKRGCEPAVQQTYDDALIARAGSIVGPHDTSASCPGGLPGSRRVAASSRPATPTIRSS